MKDKPLKIETVLCYKVEIDKGTTIFVATDKLADFLRDYKEAPSYFERLAICDIYGL